MLPGEVNKTIGNVEYVLYNDLPAGSELTLRLTNGGSCAFTTGAEFMANSKYGSIIA